MNISYDYYRVFYYVAKCRSITKASAVLMSNQPNVTRTIKALENELGCVLFVRSRQGVTLTPDGEKLYKHIRIACEQILAGEEEVAQDMDLTCGTVSVGVSEVALHNLLLPILRNYQKSYPGVHLHIANHATSQAVEALQNGLVDLAVVTTPLSVPKDMKKTTICSFREVAICGSDYTFLCGRKLSARDLASYPLISLDAQSRTFEFYSGLFQKHGVPFHPSLEVATADQVIPMVRHNLGIGFIPESFLEDYKDREEQPDFHTLELKFHIPERDICLVRHAGFNLNSAARRLEEMIVP